MISRDGATAPIVDVVIPALNEADGIADVLDAIPSFVRDVVVADNGSTDETANVATSRGARVVYEPRRGYGAACMAALAALRDPDIVVFIDADRSDRPEEMDRLVRPIIDGNADLVIGSRVRGNAERGSLTIPQRFGNRLASVLIQRIWGKRGGRECTDLGPFRAVRYETLTRLAMDDLDYGWTVQMQARAYCLGVRVREVPVTYRRRIGRSKISGTLRGVVGAGTKILSTIAHEARAGLKRQHAKRDVPKRLIVFTRVPMPGQTKTRLIPALGPDGAADLQRDMTAYTLDVARRWRHRTHHATAQIIARSTGGPIDAMQAMFGDDIAWQDQGSGTLGNRLDRAVGDAFNEQPGPVVVIGSDCPHISLRVLRAAFEALDREDVVIGPAADGGYYLIGVRAPQPALFAGIDWGSPQVHAQTIEAARRAGLRTVQLETLRDVDEPEDLPVWHAARAAAPPSGATPELSIIIPTLNEAACIEAAIASAGRHTDVEVIVVDGGSTDATVQVARRCGARVIEAKPGRAQQMNAGAMAAHGDTLLFLHADTRLPFGYRDAVDAALARHGVAAGAFRLAFDQVTPSLRFIERCANLRSRWRQMPYGDQAMFVPRQRFVDIGGFRTLPVMEDYELALQLRRIGRIELVPLHVTTSARRWRTHGAWRTTCRHQLAIVMYRLGISPARIARFLGRTLIRDRSPASTVSAESMNAATGSSARATDGPAKHVSCPHADTAQ